VTELIQTIHQSLLNLVANGIQIIPSLLLAIVVLLATRYAANPVKQLTRAALETVIQSASLRSLFLQIVSVSIWGFGIILSCIILFPDLGLGDLIGFLGLGSVAVGFAFQDIFKNFLAGVLLLLNEPFRLNDEIVVNSYQGTVEAINVRSTEIRTYTGERVVIPNSIVFTSEVQVLTDRDYRRTDLAIGLDYKTPLSRAIQVLSTTVTEVEGVLDTPVPEVEVIGFGDSCINVIVRYWTRPRMVYIRQTKSRVIMALKKACDAANFNIPYPIRTVYFFDQTRFSDHTPTSANMEAN
jgi:small-conductance mechanosensitive channel